MAKLSEEELNYNEKELIKWFEELPLSKKQMAYMLYNMFFVMGKEN